MILNCKYVYMYNLTVHEWYVNDEWMTWPLQIVV